MLYNKFQNPVFFNVIKTKLLFRIGSMLLHMPKMKIKKISPTCISSWIHMNTSFKLNMSDWVFYPPLLLLEHTRTKLCGGKGEQCLHNVEVHYRWGQQWFRLETSDVIRRYLNSIRVFPADKAENKIAMNYVSKDGQRIYKLNCQPWRIV
jgi:hypothetical protein